MYSLMSKRRNGTPSALRELLGELGLADAGRAHEQEAAGRALRAAEAGAAALHRAHDASRSPRPGRTRPRAARRRGARAARARELRRARSGDARHARDELLDVAHADRAALPSARAQPHRGAGLVHHVDRLVGQEAVVEVARARARRAARSAGCRVAHAVVLLVARREALEDLRPSSSTVGSFTSTRWKRRASARSRSKWRYSW